MTGIYRLKGQIKQYGWGGDAFLPALLHIANPDHRPFAEYWMGIHPQGPAQIEFPGGEVRLLSAVEPRMSYLLKVLDVRQMLSIQVHPNRAMAAADYERENALGIPLDSPGRNYKDPNHKPELMVALSPFWLLHGFQSPENLKKTFSKYPALALLEEKWSALGYRGLYQWLMELPQEAVDRLLKDPVAGWITEYQQGRLSKAEPAFWAARAALEFSRDGSIDRGIWSIFLFNLVKLETGQGIFQGAGVPHAYLEGSNVEIMANSDNVLRGGLTPKHIDVPELLRHLHTEPIEPDILDPMPNVAGIREFPVPVNDFSIRMVELGAGQTFNFPAGPSCLILAPQGALDVCDSEGCLNVGAPEPCVYVAPNTGVRIRALSPSVLFIASGEQGQ